MRFLLDTHVFLWIQTEPERLGDHASAIEDPAAELLVSAASSWEIAIKHEAGRLPLPDPPGEYVPARLRDIGAVPLAIEHSDALAVAKLPPLHGDPFDRLLVAQAQRFSIPLLTADRLLAEYPIETLLI